MPVTVTYPGVYIEEVPSGVRTITGVATSITAFVGRALRGPTDRPRLVQSFAEFERVYGGLWAESPMTLRRPALLPQRRPRRAHLPRPQRRGGGHAHAARPTSTSSPPARATGASACASASTTTRGPPSPARRRTRSSTCPSRTRRRATVERFLNVSAEAGHRRYVTEVLAGGVEPRPHRPGDDRRGAPDRARRSAGRRRPARGRCVVDRVPGRRRRRRPRSRDASISDSATLEAPRRGLWLLEHADLFNLLVHPAADAATTDVGKATWDAAAAYCQAAAGDADRRPARGLGRRRRRHAGDRRRRHLSGRRHDERGALLPAPPRRRPAAREPARGRSPRRGAIAGIYRAHRRAARRLEGARRARRRASAASPSSPSPLTDGENGQLNPLGDQLPARRSRCRARRLGRAHAARRRPAGLASGSTSRCAALALFIEESLYRGHAVGGLRAQRRAAVGADPAQRRRVHAEPVPPGRLPGPHAARGLLRQVRPETTTQNDINLGIVNILVGFAPLKPAEFVVIKIQQMAGQIEA